MSIFINRKGIKSCSRIYNSFWKIESIDKKEKKKKIVKRKSDVIDTRGGGGGGEGEVDIQVLLERGRDNGLGPQWNAIHDYFERYIAPAGPGCWQDGKRTFREIEIELYCPGTTPGQVCTLNKSAVVLSCALLPPLPLPIFHDKSRGARKSNPFPSRTFHFRTNSLFKRIFFF